MYKKISRTFCLIFLNRTVLIAIGFLAAWPASSSADWEVRKITDSMTDVQTVVAAVRKPGCCAIHVLFNEIGLTFAPVIRFDNVKGPLLPKLELRVDKHKLWSLEGRATSDRTLMFDKSEDLTVLLRQMAGGSILRLRYWNKSSGSSIVELPLTAAYQSLQKAERWAIRNGSDAIEKMAEIGIPYKPLFPLRKREAEPSGQKPVSASKKKTVQPVVNSKRFENLLRRAQAGDSDAQYALAFAYGPPVNRISAEVAFEYLRKSAGAGNLHGLAELGAWQVLGKGTEVDIDRGLATLEKAGSQGHPNGYFTLGAFYDGQAKKQIASDNAKAIRYYEACIELQDRKAVDGKTMDFYVRQCLTKLGRHHLLGSGTRKDLYRARALFQQAADMGEPIGMYYLAFNMLKGEGGGKDREGAVAWLRKAKAAGHKSAEKALADLSALASSTPTRSKPTAKQIAAARKKRPKYILYAFMAKANERARLTKYKPSDVNIYFGMLSGNPESEIFHGMLLQNNDFLQKRFIGSGTPHRFKSRGEMRNAMLDTYDPNDPYKPMRFTPVGHEIMHALANHMKLEIFVEAVAREASKRRNRK